MDFLLEYTVQWSAALWGIILLGCLAPLRRLVGLPAALLVGWLLSSAVLVTFWPLSAVAGLPAEVQNAVRLYSLDSAFKLLLVFVPLLYLARRSWENLLGLGGILTCAFSLINAITICAQFVSTDDHCRAELSCGGIVGNPSMSAGLLVVMLPIAFRLLDPVLRHVNLAAVVAAVFISKASVPIGLLGALLALAALSLPWGARLAAGLVGAGAVAAGYALLGSELLNSGDRVLMWRFFFEKWMERENLVLGTGFGTFGVFSYTLQHIFHVRENGWWVWPHNDWLEMLVTCGGIGLFLLAVTYFDALISAFRRPHKAVAFSLSLYGIMMLVNYPMHLAPTALYGAWLAVVVLTKPESTEAGWIGKA